MTELLNRVALFIEQLIMGLGYVGITLVMLVENLFPPIPSELVMPLAGFFAAQGKFHPILVWLAGTLGSVLGAIALYYFGAWTNERVLRWVLSRYGRWIGVSVGDVDRVLRIFETRGELIVFVGRLIPVVRSLISIPAGMKRMPMTRFLIFTTAGSAIWTGLLTAVGMLLGENWQLVLGYLKTYQSVALAAIICAVIVLALWKVGQDRRIHKTMKIEE